MSNPAFNSTYAPNTSLNSTANTASDPFAQSGDPFANSNNANNNRNATRATGQVVNSYTPAAGKGDPVAVPTGVCILYCLLCLIFEV